MASLRANIVRDQREEEEDPFAKGFYEATLRGPSRGERVTMEPPSPEHDQLHPNAPASPRGDWDEEDKIPYAARFFDPGAKEPAPGDWTNDDALAKDHTGPYGYRTAGAAGRNEDEDKMSYAGWFVNAFGRDLGTGGTHVAGPGEGHKDGDGVHPTRGNGWPTPRTK